MLHRFNRREVFMTYDEKNKDAVIRALEKHGIEYVVKITKVKNEYKDEVLGDQHHGAYIIYVHQEDVEEALRFARCAIFPDES